MFFGSSLSSLGSLSSSNAKSGDILTGPQCLIRTFQLKLLPHQFLLIERRHLVTIDATPSHLLLDVLTQWFQGNLLCCPELNCIIRIQVATINISWQFLDNRLTNSIIFVLCCTVEIEGTIKILQSLVLYSLEWISMACEMRNYNLLYLRSVGFSFSSFSSSNSCLWLENPPASLT